MGTSGAFTRSHGGGGRGKRVKTARRNCRVVVGGGGGRPAAGSHVLKLAVGGWLARPGVAQEGWGRGRPLLGKARWPSSGGRKRTAAAHPRPQGTFVSG